MSENLYESKYINAAECQQQLQRTKQYQKLLGRILGRIRASVDVESLCADTSQDICWLLSIERVAIYHLLQGGAELRFLFPVRDWEYIA